MESFSRETILNASAPCAQTCPTVSSAVISNHDIVIPSCSYAQPVLLSSYIPSKQSILKLSSVESINHQLDRLIRQKLVYRLRQGQTHDTLSFHCCAIIKEMKQTLYPYDESLQDFSFRDRLITLLASSSKVPILDIPTDLSEWFKLLNQWIRSHIVEDVIFNRDIYEILAVDGFYGFKPKELKHYLMRILQNLRHEFQLHTKSVRAMYLWISKNPLIASLPGTDSACLVFLSLLEFYSEQLHTLVFDNQVQYQLQQAKSQAEGFLHKHSDYYRDIMHVDETLVTSLARVYSKEFNDPEKCKTVAEEMLKLIK